MSFLFLYGLKHRQFEWWVENTTRSDIKLNFVQFYGVTQSLYKIEATHKSFM